MLVLFPVLPVVMMMVPVVVMMVPVVMMVVVRVMPVALLFRRRGVFAGGRGPRGLCRLGAGHVVDLIVKPIPGLYHKREGGLVRPLLVKFRRFVLFVLVLI
jgi:hypothetical protein